MSERLTIGFLPLVDACLPILARELGFAEAEGLDLQLTRDVTWACWVQLSGIVLFNPPRGGMESRSKK